MKLAEALLRRKELQQKVEQLRPLQQKDLFEDVVQRVPVADGLDEVKARVCKVTMATVTQEFDFYASALRRVDALIQKTNWEAEVQVQPGDMLNFADYLQKTSPQAAVAT